jgi:hypothetical protein
MQVAAGAFLFFLGSCFGYVIGFFVSSCWVERTVCRDAKLARQFLLKAEAWEEYQAKIKPAEG